MHATYEDGVKAKEQGAGNSSVGDAKGSCGSNILQQSAHVQSEAFMAAYLLKSSLAGTSNMAVRMRT